MRIAKDKVDVQMEIPGAVIRQRTEFGDVSGFDTISGEYFTLSTGVDTTPLFQGLEGDLCQCPHWGFVLSGQLTTTDANGARQHWTPHWSARTCRASGCRQGSAAATIARRSPGDSEVPGWACRLLGRL